MAPESSAVSRLADISTTAIPAGPLPAFDVRFGRAGRGNAGCGT